MILELVYDEINKRMDKIDFSTLFPKFHKFNFSVYDNDFFVLNGMKEPILDVFIGNTAIEFRGNYIAIWNLAYEDEEIDFDILTSNIIHEMFHCFQKEQKESRFPDDLILLDYPDNLENYGLKMLENKILIESLDEKEKMFDFISIRKQRETIIGKAIEQEYKVETIEGLAEYIGTLALKLLSIDKYQHRIHTYKKILLEKDDIQFSIRRISYYVGTIFYLVMNKHHVILSKNLDDAEPYMRQIKFLENNEQKPKFIPFNCCELLDNYIIMKKNKFSDFLAQSVEEIIFDADIVGYDPMNMMKMDDQILCKHFIMLGNGDETKMIQEPCLLNMKKGNPRSIYSYLIKKEQSL